MFAGRVGVEALDLVHEAVLEKEIERPVDGRRRDRLAFAARHFLDDRIGAERRGAVAENVEHPPAQCGVSCTPCRTQARSTCVAQVVGSYSQPHAFAIVILSVKLLHRRRSACRAASLSTAPQALRGELL